MGAAGGYGLSAVALAGAGAAAIGGFNRRSTANLGLTGMTAVKENVTKAKRINPVSSSRLTRRERRRLERTSADAQDYQRRKTARLGSYVAKGVTRGGNVSPLPPLLASPMGSGATVNPAAGSAVTEARGRATRGIFSDLFGGFF